MLLNVPVFCEDERGGNPRKNAEVVVINYIMLMSGGSMKTCTQCKKELDENKFYGQTKKGKRGQLWKYLDSMCRNCRGKYTRIRRLKNKWLAILHLGGECQECGQEVCKSFPPQLFDFHHADKNKEYAIADCFTRAFENIKGEIEKCQLLCSICHRRIHLDEESMKLWEEIMD